MTEVWEILSSKVYFTVILKGQPCLEEKDALEGHETVPRMTASIQ